MKFALLILLCFYSPIVVGQQIRILTWNIENLFDARHDTLKHDEEFLPESERQWTWGRYWRKIEDVSRVVMGVGESEPPALVAFQEVENDSCMIALTRRGTLRTCGYKYVMTNSPDVRGIDVALMYRPDVFRLIMSESWRVPSQEHGLRPTRDILHASGQFPNGDTLHVVVCHLPSRAGDARQGMLNRQLAVSTLCSKLDYLIRNVPDCRLIVMGDFNATLRDKSLRPLLSLKGIRPLTPLDIRPNEGTYRFQGTWSWIDHVFVSDNLIGSVSDVKLYTQPWMQRPSDDGTWYPRRTYLGTKYNGGVSDHVPVYLDLDPLFNSPEGESLP